MSETSFALRAVSGAYGELERGSSGGLRQLASDAVGLYRSIMGTHPIPTVRDAMESQGLFESKFLPRVTVSEDPIVGFDAHLKPIVSGTPNPEGRFSQPLLDGRATVLASWQRDEKRLVASTEVSDLGLAPQNVPVDHDLAIVRDRHGVDTLRATAPLPPEMHVFMGPGKTDITPWLNFNAGSPLGRLSERLGNRPALLPDSTIHIQFDPTKDQTGFMRTVLFKPAELPRA